MDSIKASVKREIESIINSNSNVVIAAKDANDFEILSKTLRKNVEIAQIESLLKSSENTKRFNIIILYNIIESLPKKKTQHLISKTRDILATSVYLFLDYQKCSTWNSAELVALGFRVEKEYRKQKENWDLYHFNMGDYKKTPDWLNSKDWANPENWDKFRW